MERSTKITSTESGILQLLQKGFSNKKISKETGVTINTVKYHLKQIYKKLHAHNRVEAINKFKDINSKPHTQ
ncbi:MAG TPA: response regulator transcription factor [Candidatus Cloacimonetes bacterium]|nr:response regulator transcription factor [Candidatus Cloacimonadota bacterium]